MPPKPRKNKGDLCFDLGMSYISLENDINQKRKTIIDDLVNFGTYNQKDVSDFITKSYKWLNLIEEAKKECKVGFLTKRAKEIEGIKKSIQEIEQLKLPIKKAKQIY